MKPLSLSVVLAAAFASSTAHGSETGPPAPDAASHVIPALYTPATITRSGREFIARCDDEAFAKARFPKKLAAYCEDLLARWHGEASDRGNLTAGAEPIPDYSGALRFSTLYTYPSPPGERR
jgi:hypothetical protein